MHKYAGSLGVGVGLNRWRNRVNDIFVKNKTEVTATTPKVVVEEEEFTRVSSSYN